MKKVVKRMALHRETLVHLTAGVDMVGVVGDPVPVKDTQYFSCSVSCPDTQYFSCSLACPH